MKPYVLHYGDCIEVMRGMADNSVDSIVTDPPYHLTSNSGGPSAKGQDTPQGRAKASASRTGFMGKTWDGGDIAQSVELWTEALRVLKPGGHLLAFSGTRTQHRMVCAIEDAGFDIRDQIGWCFGSGFPKSRNIAEHDMDGADADRWAGWGTALKPAWEPICVARKPLVGTVAANVLAHGTGALNIDGCRVPGKPEAPGSTPATANGNGRTLGAMTRAAYEAPTGRWPANIIHDGSDEVVALFPAQAGQQAALKTRNSDKTRNVLGTFAGTENANFAPHDERGSAARFFYCAKASRSDRNEGLEDPGPQFTRVSTLRDAENLGDDRKGNHHPTVKPTDLMAYLCRLVTPPGGKVLDMFMGSGSTGKACMREGFEFVGIDMTAEYIPIAEARIEHEHAKVVAANTPPAPAPQLDLFAMETA